MIVPTVRASVAALVAFGALALPATAAAKATEVSPYSYKQTFGTALRLLKVDLELEVTDLDAEWGYVLFHYVSSESGKRKNRGSLQFVQLEQAVQVAVQLPQMPSYHEQLIVDKLKRKLVEDYGTPPKRRPPSPPPEGDDKRKDDAGQRKDDEGRTDDGSQQPSDSDRPRIIEPKREPLRRRKG